MFLNRKIYGVNIFSEGKRKFLPIPESVLKEALRYHKWTVEFLPQKETIMLERINQQVAQQQ